MRAESITPGSIPFYEDLETIAVKTFPTARAQMLFEAWSANSEKLLESLKDRQKYIASDTLLTFAGRIAQAHLAVNPDVSMSLQDEIARHVYVGFSVGMCLSQWLVQPHMWSMVHDGFPEQGEEVPFYQNMSQATGKYMLERPALDALIGEGVEGIIVPNTTESALEVSLPVAETSAQYVVLQTEAYRLSLYVPALERHNRSNADNVDFRFFDSQFDS
ncbi:MAG: hypothetical protein ABIR37_00370 [Candidatus Saccharimonadales bacterium]